MKKIRKLMIGLFVVTVMCMGFFASNAKEVEATDEKGCIDVKVDDIIKSSEGTFVVIDVSEESYVVAPIEQERLGVGCPHRYFSDEGKPMKRYKKYNATKHVEETWQKMRCKKCGKYITYRIYDTKYVAHSFMDVAGKKKCTRCGYTK